MKTGEIPALNGEDGVTLIMLAKHDMSTSQRLASLYSDRHDNKDALGDWDDSERKSKTFLTLDYDSKSKSWGTGGCNGGTIESYTASKSSQKSDFQLITASWQESAYLKLTRDSDEPFMEVSDHELNEVNEKGMRLMIGGIKSPFSGQVAEVLIYPRILPPSERLKITCYLSLKFALNLPICAARPLPKELVPPPKECLKPCQKGTCKGGTCICSRGYFGSDCSSDSPKPAEYNGLQLWLSGYRFDSSMSSWPGNAWKGMSELRGLKVCHEGAEHVFILFLVTISP